MSAPAALPVARLQDVIARLVPAMPGLRLVVLFGSVARATARADSDVDVGLLGAAHWQGLDLGAQFAGVLGREPHVIELERATELLQFQIARDGVLLYEREPFAWARFQAGAMIRYFDIAPMIALCAEGARQRLLREAAHG